MPPGCPMAAPAGRRAGWRFPRPRRAPATWVRPGPVFLAESAGLYNQNQLIANVNAKLNAGFSLFGFYVLNHARSNTDGIGTFPANPYSFSGEYGPASTDVHHRFTIGGSLNLRGGGGIDR